MAREYRQDHHKAREGSDAAADPNRAKRPPVDLCLLSSQRGQSAIHRRGGRGPDQAHRPAQLHDRSGVAAPLHHLEESRRAQARILRERVTNQRQVRIELRGAARAAAHALRIVHERRPDGVMVDAEGRGDGADLPVLAVIQATNLGVLLGRDHDASPGTRDESARAVVGARRFPGHRPCIATHPPGARSAPDPSSCPPAVWQERRRVGKSDPSRGRGRRAGDRDDRGGLRDCGGDGGGRRGPTRGGRPCDTPASNRRGRDHRRGRSRTVDCSVDRFSGEAAHPRRRSGGALRLDTTRKSWHKRDDWLGPSEHRGGHRGPGGQAPGLHLNPPSGRQPTAIH